MKMGRNRALVFMLALILPATLPAGSFAQSWTSGNRAELEAPTSRVLIADIDGDGRGDVLAVSGGNLVYVAGDGKGGFSGSPRTLRESVYDAAVGSFIEAKPGRNDLVIIGSDLAQSGVGLFLLPWLGTPVFSTATVIPTTGISGFDANCRVVAADLNGDHAQDIVVFCPTNPTQLFVALNDSLGHFSFQPLTPVESNRHIDDVSAGDIYGSGADSLLIRSIVPDDSDGRLDSLTYSASQGFRIRRTSLPSSPLGIAANVNGDLYTDLIGGDGYKESVWLGDGKGASGSAIALPGFEGCTTNGITAGHLVRASGMRGLDIAESLSCSGVTMLGTLINTTQSLITVKTKAVFQRAKYRVILTVSVVGDKSGVPATGDVMVFGTEYKSKQPLGTDGTSDFEIQLKKGRNSLTFLYPGDSMHAAAWKPLQIQLPDLDNRDDFPSPEALLKRHGLRDMPWRSDFSTGSQGRSVAKYGEDSCDPPARLVLAQHSSTGGGASSPGWDGPWVLSSSYYSFGYGTQPSVFNVGSNYTLQFGVTASGGVVPNGGTVSWYDNGTYIGAAGVTGTDSWIVQNWSNCAGSDGLECSGDCTAFPDCSAIEQDSAYNEDFYDLAYSFTSAGSHTIHAVFNPPSGWASVNDSQTITVTGKATPTVTVSCSPNPITYGPQTTTCTAHTSGGSGTMAFTIDGGAWFTGTVNGSGNVSGTGFNTYPAGSHTIAANYSGDSNYNGASGSTVLTINKATPTVSVSCSPNPITYGTQTTSCTAHTTGGGGSVTLYYNGYSYLWGSGSFDGNGNFTITGYNGQPAGSYTVIASSSGDSNYNGASGTTTVTINKATPTLSVSCSANPITYAQATTCTPSLTAGSGSLTWSYSGPTSSTWLTGASLTASQTGFNGNPAGIYTVTTTYSGDGNYNSVSASTTLTINKATPTITWANPAAITYGTALSATQLNATSGGVAGTFVYVPASGTVLGVGSQTLSVTFTPTDTTDYNNRTATATITVSPAPTVTELTSSNNPITFGGSTTVRALIDTGGIAPTGTVAFTSNGVSIGSGSVSTLSTTNLVPYSSQIGGASWGGFCETSATQVINTPAVAAPNGTQTATMFVMPNTTPPCGGGGNQGALASIPGGLVAGQIYTVSVWLRGAVGGETVNIGTNDAYYAGVTLSTSWQRFSVTFTPYVSGGEDNRGFEMYGTTANETFYAWGAQTEAASTEGPYIATQASSASGSGGVATLTTSALLAGSDALVATYNGDANALSSVSHSLTETVTKATPTITWANPAAITYGTALSATQLNATSGGVAGTFVYTPASGTVLGVGSQTLSVTFTPTDTTDYNSQTATVTLTVTKATPTITWANPAAITYGTALSATQLNATSGGLAGSFVYTPASGTVLGAGAQTLSVTFTPTDATDYSSQTANVTLTVTKVTPTITWANPSAITYGTALSGTQLNATASVPGSFVYVPASGTVLGAGTQTLSVTFTPTDTTDYNSQTATVTLTVTKATPTITWANPAVITYGTALSSTQLNATASVPGSFVYTPVAGTVLGVGSHTLSATFTPTDATDYTSQTATTTLSVSKAAVTVTKTVSRNPANYGDNVTFTFLFTGTATTPTGTAALSDGATQLGIFPLDALGRVIYSTSNLGAGSHNITASYSGDSSYY